MKRTEPDDDAAVDAFTDMWAGYIDQRVAQEVEKALEDRPKYRLGPVEVMLIVFAVLKLAGVAPVAGWSWWWVLSPAWGALSLIGLHAVLTAVVHKVFD
jgi:hypothetical protein